MPLGVCRQIGSHTIIWVSNISFANASRSISAPGSPFKTWRSISFAGTCQKQLEKGRQDYGELIVNYLLVSADSTETLWTPGMYLRGTLIPGIGCRLSSPHCSSLGDPLYPTLTKLFCKADTETFNEMFSRDDLGYILGQNLHKNCIWDPFRQAVCIQQWKNVIICDLTWPNHERALRQDSAAPFCHKLPELACRLSQRNWACWKLRTDL